MFQQLFYVSILLAFTLGKNCDHLGVNFYEEIGCKALTKDNEECPSKFDCPDFAPIDNTCLYRSITYNQSDRINDDLTYGACKVGCFCSETNSFTCGILDCPEWLGLRPSEGCYFNYTLEKCCSTGQICEPFDDAATCSVNNKTFKEGQRFSSEGSCMTCVCHKGWKGKFEEPFCTKVTCASQIEHGNDLANNCAIAYFKKDGPLCCPYSFICDSQQEIKDTKGLSGKASDQTCKFGSRTVPLGHGFNETSNILEDNEYFACECVLPPLLTCRKRELD